MKMLRRAGYRSVHAGQQELTHEILRMLVLGGMHSGLKQDLIKLLGSPGTVTFKKVVTP